MHSHCINPPQSLGSSKRYPVYEVQEIVQVKMHALHMADLVLPWALNINSKLTRTDS